MGNPVLRSLLVVGATAVSRHARRGATVSPWLTGLQSYGRRRARWIGKFGADLDSELGRGAVSVCLAHVLNAPGFSPGSIREAVRSR